ncbi:hypothetical protein [Streptomyces capoamus]|uniref:hypothetical protein n=1 Tax=Streptomyces capoamus TaxID=68183 RepID=UPI001677A20D|nr:hypothetical protein [Streptomyces capoamus]
MNRLIRAAVAAAAALATVICTSPSAASDPWAPKPRACNTNAAGAQLHTTEAVRLRADRGTRSRVLAVLPKNTDFYAECWGVAADDAWWAYGEVMSGPRRQHQGWVAGTYVAQGCRH